MVRISKAGAEDELRRILSLLDQEDLPPSRLKTARDAFNRFFELESRIAPRRSVRQTFANQGLNEALRSIRVQTDRLRIDTLLNVQESKIRSRIKQFLDDVRSTSVEEEVSEMLEARDVERVLELADAYVTRVGNVVPEVFQALGVDEAEQLTLQIGAEDARVVVSFDPAHPRAAERVRRSQLDLIREVSRSQRNTIRTALSEAFEEGKGPREAARVFRDSIGLTETQRQSVENYRRLLERGSREALSRGLRDRRFDRTIRRAINEDEPLSSSQIQRMVDRYRERYLIFRSETIARTETLRAANEAREEALRQAVEQTGIDPKNVRREWRTTLDARVRDTHDAMEGQEVGLNESFQSPSGATLRYPGDSRAPAAETINCRCVVLHNIKSEDLPEG